MSNSYWGHPIYNNNNLYKYYNQPTRIYNHQLNINILILKFTTSKSKNKFSFLNALNLHCLLHYISIYKRILHRYILVYDTLLFILNYIHKLLPSSYIPTYTYVYVHLLYIPFSSFYITQWFLVLLLNPIATQYKR